MFRFDDTKLTDLHARLLAIANGAAWLGDGAVPALEQLRSLIEIAMALTLEREEGRQLRFALDFVPPARVASSPADFLVTLDSPIAVSQLRRFAVALDPWNTPIAVRPSASEWEAYGVVTLFRQEDGDPLRLGDLIVRGLGAGVVQVEMRAQVVARIAFGSTAVDLPDSRQIHSFVRGLWGAELSHQAVVTAFELARRMISIGHGGSLVLLDDEISASQANLQVKYSFATSNGLLADRVNAALRSHDELSRSPEQLLLAVPQALLRLREGLDRVAKFTSTDGALVMTDDLHIRGFGAVLSPGTAPLTHVTLIGPSLTQTAVVPLAALGGTRQQSAARWLAGLPAESRAIVLTVSVDGGLRLFGRLADGAVVCYGPLALRQQSDGQ